MESMRMDRLSKKISKKHRNRISKKISKKHRILPLPSQPFSVLRLGRRKKLRKQWKGLSKALKGWASNPKKTIWEIHGTSHDMWRMSDDFRKFMRPIFYAAYQCLHVKKGVHPCLGRVAVKNGQAMVRNLCREEPSLQEIRACIRHLRDIIQFIVRAENRFRWKKFPCVVEKFFSLCDFALDKRHSREDLWNLAYLTTINPIIFDVTDSMYFIEKCWNLLMMDKNAFYSSIECKEMTGYIHRVTGAMEELNAVKMFEGNDPHAKLSQEEREKKLEKLHNMYLESPSCILFAMNVTMHFQGYDPAANVQVDFELKSCNASLERIHEQLMEVLYDMIPRCFSEMAINFYRKKYFFMGGLWSYVELLKENPKILKEFDGWAPPY